MNKLSLGMPVTFTGVPYERFKEDDSRNVVFRYSIAGISFSGCVSLMAHLHTSRPTSDRRIGRQEYQYSCRIPVNTNAFCRRWKQHITCNVSVLPLCSHPYVHEHDKSPLSQGKSICSSRLQNILLLVFSSEPRPRLQRPPTNTVQSTSFRLCSALPHKSAPPSNHNPEGEIQTETASEQALTISQEKSLGAATSRTHRIENSWYPH